MEQIKVGRFITKKRKEQNLTQEQLAERLGISNKTISKWETGKCMPDYAVVKNLCEELNVSVSELMDGEETDDKSIRMYDEEQILDLLRRTQELEKQKVMLTGVVLIVMGVAFQSLSHTLGGSDVKDFFSGLLLGLSVAEMLAGIAVICKGAIIKCPHYKLPLYFRIRGHLLCFLLWNQADKKAPSFTEPLQFWECMGAYCMNTGWYRIRLHQISETLHMWGRVSPAFRAGFL